MEGDLMDEVYGDLSQDHHNTTAAFNEDSVDIYFGLESPKMNSNAERNYTLLSPQNLKYMDLYEEIITEEQQDRESSYNELRTRFNAAQSQVDELMRRLQQTETQNTTLNTENSRLKKNICALIKTAKMEVVRKDEEINRLSQSFRPRRGPVVHHQSQMNCLRNQIPTKQNPTGQSQPSQPQVPTRLNPTGPSQLSQPQVPTRLNPTGQSQPSQPQVPTRLNPTGQSQPSQPQVPTRLNPTGPSQLSQPQVPTRLNPTGPSQLNQPLIPTRQNLTGQPPPSQPPGPRQDCVVKDLSQLLCKDRDVVHPLLPPTPSDATVFRPPLPDTTVLRPPLPVTSKTAKGDSEAPVKRTVGSSSQDSVNRHPTRELDPSDKPKQTKHREGEGGNPRLSHSNEQRKYNSKSSRCPRLSDVEVRRRSERAKNPTSDILHCTASSDRTSEGLSKDCAAYQSKCSSRHYQELRRDKGDDNRHSRGTKDISSNRKHAYLNQASITERSSESFNRKGGTSPPRDHRRKEERRREDEVRKENNTSKKSGERKSTCTERRRAKESDRCSRDVSKDKTMDDSKVGRQKTGEKSELLPSEAKVAAKSSVEETGPNRKLSFMETLNLTLSPVKKPRRLAETKEQEGTPPEEVPEDQSAEDGGQPDLDKLLILDEINSSVVETDEVFEDPVVQPSSEIPMPSEPGSIDLRHTDKEPCQDANKGLAEATVAKKPPKCQLEVEDTIVQDVSEGRPELPEATVDQRTEPTTPEPLREVCVSAPVCAIVLRTPLKSRPEECASVNKVSESEDFTAAAVTAITVAGNCGNNSNTDTGLSSNGFTPDHSMENVVLITDNWVCKPNGKTSSALVCESPAVETVTQVPPAAVCVGHPAVEGVPGKEPSESLQLPLPASVISTSSLDVTAEVQDISKHGVSSTISMEGIPEICITSEIVEDATEIPLECEKERTVVEQGSPLSGFEVSKVSSTTEEVAPSAQHNSGLSQTPKKSLDSEPSHTENEDVTVEPSSSIPLAHDEDSMMLTLGSLKGIPDAISPLTSPVRPMRESHQPPCHSKPAYVKSLRKEFTSAAGDPNSKKLDVNMENKNPGRSIASATQQDVDRASVCSSSPEDELEEGEILSEGEETPITPSSPAKTVRPTSTVKSQQIPKSSPRLSKKLPEEKGNSKLLSKTLISPVGSPMSKARYKTVQPPLPKAALCTVEEVMAMFVKIRYACRKKYMKLRSTFSKERFCGVMDMSLDSFTDFVDSVSFTKLCSQEDDLKVKLKNNIMSVLSKLSNNGIVNRIFDQEPLNMKSKLWEFVNVQLDFLFKEIQTALRSVCKSSNGNQSAGAEKKDLSLSKQPVKSPKQPVKSPKQPVKSPKQPVKSPKQPVKSPKQPVKSPKQPVKSPKQPVKSPKQPVKSPKQPVKSPKQPVKSPKQPVKSPKQPVKSPKQPVKSSVSTASKLKRPQGTVQKTNCVSRTSASKRPQEELTECVEPNIKRTRVQTLPPCKTGLGRGKNIKMSFEEDEESEPQTSDHPLMQPPMQPPLQHGLEILSSNSPSSAEKTVAYVRRLSQNGSLHDKSDFEILTEQQASNLTFNLVTDSQMGEIFKCLLQGSDLLETSVSAGDNQGWPLGTPRKGERFRGVTTPSKVGTTTKVGTPSKVIATWSSISPCKFSSPNSKVQIPLNPALLDESCMLEVPSSLPEDKMTSQSSVFSQSSYSILAEDLAVSLTIPSPLKSDNHLSFLHPASVEPMSAPDSVISAHFSEDALMDGEDATEQDIHLALDTDNSSGASSGGGRTREAPVNPLFHFKPHLPMQAVVMEKSNDHFIVRIRHANTSPDIKSNNSGVNFTNLGINCTNPGINFSNLGNNSTSLVVNPTCLGIKSTSQGVNSSSPGSVNSTYPGNNSTNPDTNSSYLCVNSTSPQVNCTNPGIYPISADINPRAVSSPQTPPGEEQHGKDQAHPTGKTPSKTHFSEASPPFYLSTSTETASALSSPCLTIIEDTPERDHSKGKTGKKRTRHHVEMKAKRPKKEVIPEKIKHKKKSSKRAKGKETRSSKSERSKGTTPPQSTPSPNSLSAKNIIIRKGAVVVTWTRDEDRDILLALKMKGASPDTFSSLSEKMNKTPAQIAERFSQLMKLFKKKKMMSQVQGSNLPFDE
ncbi:CASP8-associated protein 2 isoform X3 [Oncorhynchus mykiss]|uniref:CASP8-associated protein 2 isoform X3 n=1 Tax=Oncorhynchus mykiss TaxID=8022 RepID=UPI001878507F|nr:CASP8-associated protein 2 isoform X3 [Oncorhynchus mykiss]